MFCNTRCRNKRSGNVLVLSLFLMLGLLGLLAFSIDLGWIYMTRGELQRSADAAALAAAAEMLQQQIDENGEATPSMATTAANAEAALFAGYNLVNRQAPTLAEDDVTVGYLGYGSTSILQDPTMPYNAVRVRVQRSNAANGQVPLFFARALGMQSARLQCEATAAYWNSFSGFQAPSDGSKLNILPIALDRPTWDALVAGSGDDDYSYDPDSNTIGNGPDGVPEASLYPKGTGAPGNRGTVDIGSNNNSTNDLKRQITDGVSEADLAYHGGKLELDADGVLLLNGDTGISAGIKSALEQIIGEPKVIPIFDEVTGNGNNAYYKITGFAGVRILDVKLTGSMNSKHITIQPAQVQVRGAIPTSDPGANNSYYIYSPVVLVH